jgi:DNA polymerase III sliding clamp (beta) subunit (PCNA family)
MKNTIKIMKSCGVSAIKCMRSYSVQNNIATLHQFGKQFSNDMALLRFPLSTPDGYYSTVHLLAGAIISSDTPAPDFDAQLEIIGEYEVSADTFGHVSTAVSADETRYCMNGVFLDGTAKRIVATDGRRLHMMPVWALKDSSSAIMKLSGAEKYMGKKSRIYVIRDAAGRVFTQFDAQGVTVIKPVIDGQFPNYERVLPESKELYASVTLPALDVLKQWLPIIKAQKEGGKVIFRKETQALTCYEGHTIASVEVTGDDIAYNIAFLIDAIKAGATKLLYGKPTRATYTQLDNDLTIVIMPMEM